MTGTEQLSSYSIRDTATFYEAMVKINENASHAVFVLDDSNKLLGSVTDGDIRRALIAGEPDLNRLVLSAMQPRVRFMSHSATDQEQRAFMRKFGIEQLPLVDADRRLIRVVLASTLFAARRRNTPVMLMAGGLGTRLGDLTRDRPKPLVLLDDKPIMEHILLKFFHEGFRRFFVSINHLGDMVRDHFGDGTRFGVSITYIKEEKRLGTAGALSLIDFEDFDSLFVSNCDVISQMEYSDMLDFHETQANDMTMGVVAEKFSIPFGVVETVSSKVVGFREKPEYEVSVNAGVYVLKRELIHAVPHDTQFDMPQLLDIALARGNRCAAYSINDQWIDVGRPDDLERARKHLSGTGPDSGIRTATVMAKSTEARSG
ncbi:MAG: nucleotidyltransferase family protein [Rhizobiaceae bacterium]|nr:nucleotidyltransferase family protein [Rhizobiaceae bacterium]